MLIGLIVYAVFGLASEFMLGYAKPGIQDQTSIRKDWFTFLIWPVFFPSTVGSFGAALRYSKKGL